MPMGRFQGPADSLGCFPGTGLSGPEPRARRAPSAPQPPRPRSQPRAELEPEHFFGESVLLSRLGLHFLPSSRSVGPDHSPRMCAWVLGSRYRRASGTGAGVQLLTCWCSVAVSLTALLQLCSVGQAGLKGLCPGSPPAHPCPL